MTSESGSTHAVYIDCVNVFTMGMRLLTMISLQYVDLAVKSMKVRTRLGTRDNDPFVISAYRLLSSYGTSWTISLVFILQLDCPITLCFNHISGILNSTYQPVPP